MKFVLKLVEELIANVLKLSQLKKIDKDLLILF
jgi:hypothetical protein